MSQKLRGLLREIKEEKNVKTAAEKAVEFVSTAQKLIEGKPDLASSLTGDEILAIAEGIGWLLSPEAGRKWEELKRRYKKGLPREEADLGEVKKTQLRKFLDMVNRVKSEFDPDSAVMLHYRMAYAASRERGLRPFLTILEPALAKIGARREKRKEAEADFRRLARLVEAVVAYHAFYGGRD